MIHVKKEIKYRWMLESISLIRPDSQIKSHVLCLTKNFSWMNTPNMRADAQYESWWTVLQRLCGHKGSDSADLSTIPSENTDQFHIRSWSLSQMVHTPGECVRVCVVLQCTPPVSYRILSRNIKLHIVKASCVTVWKVISPLARPGKKT